MGSGCNYEHLGKELSLGANHAVSLEKCDILVTTSYLFRDDCTDIQTEKRKLMMGLGFKRVYVDTKCGLLSSVLPCIRRHNITWDEMVTVNPDDRAQVVVSACGKDLRVSTGVWAVCLAVISSPKSVTVTGVSLEDGYYKMDSDAPSRDHVAEDRECLRGLLRYIRVDSSLRDKL